MSEQQNVEKDVVVGDLTVRVRGGKPEVVERRRKVGRDVLACGYVCGVIDSDEDGVCWSYDHGGSRCPVVSSLPSEEHS